MVYFQFSHCDLKYKPFGSVALLCLTLTTPRTAACQASLSIIDSQGLLKVMSIKSVMPSNHLILCHPLFLAPSIFPSIRVFSDGHQVAKVLEFQLQDQSFQWIFRTDFLEDWMVESPCSPEDSQESSSTSQLKVSILKKKKKKQSINASALSFIYSPILTSIPDYWKNHSFNQMDFVSKAMSLLFNMLSRLVIAFCPRSKHLLISWLQSQSAVILETPPKNKVSHCFPCFPIYLPWSHGTRCHDLSFLNVEGFFF